MGSTGGGNTLCEHFSWRLIGQCLAWSFVELSGDGAWLGLAEDRQVGAFGKILAQQSVGVFVGAALPRASGIAKIDVHVGGQGEAAVVGQFLAAVPGERLIELARQFAGLFDQRRDDAGGIRIGDLDQHHVARLALDQRRDVAAPRASDEVALPMSGDGAILDRCRPLADRYCVLQLTKSGLLQAGMARAADRAPGPQMLEKLLLQDTARLNIQAFVDRLV